MSDSENVEPTISSSNAALRTPASSVAMAEPLVDRGDLFLVVDPERDGITSGFRGAVFSVDANLYLTEGISLSGTHLGLNLISTSGVVLICQDARILPSRNRPSSIAAEKVVIAGEAVLERLQGDKLVVFADNSKIAVCNLLRGEASLITDKADWILTGQARKLKKNEPRVGALYEEAMHDCSFETGGFDAIREEQEKSI